MASLVVKIFMLFFIGDMFCCFQPIFLLVNCVQKHQWLIKLIFTKCSPN